MSIRAFGDGALLLTLGDRIDRALVARAAAIADVWERDDLGEAIPTYASVVLRFDPLRLQPEEAERTASALVERAAPASVPARARRLVEIPTRYDGPDLEEVARLSRLTVDELVRAHSGRTYRAHFLGFMPGYAYCGELDPRIVAPRLASPRVRVPAGAVAIADGQTSVYPFESPGGWRLIGSTDARIFDPAREPAALIRAGDDVKFVMARPGGPGGGGRGPRARSAPGQ